MLPNLKSRIVGLLVLFFSCQLYAQKIAVSNSYLPKNKQSFYWAIYLVADPASLRSISSVEYTLHETFERPVQIIKADNNNPDFTFHAVGWGEFDIKVKIAFKESNRRALYLVHSLDLHTPPRAYIKYFDPSSKTSADRIKPNLEKAGFTIAGISRTASKNNTMSLPEVRYYREEEKTEATKLVGLLRQYLPKNISVSKVPKRVVATESLVRPRHYEIWFP